MCLFADVTSNLLLTRILLHDTIFVFLGSRRIPALERCMDPRAPVNHKAHTQHAMLADLAEALANI